MAEAMREEALRNPRAPPVSDVRGQDLRPDSAASPTPAEFIDALRRCGDPGSQELPRCSPVIVPRGPPSAGAEGRRQFNIPAGGFRSRETVRIRSRCRALHN